MISFFGEITASQKKNDWLKIFLGKKHFFFLYIYIKKNILNLGEWVTPKFNPQKKRFLLPKKTFFF